MKKLYENDLFIIEDTGHNYDFKYVIENKKNKKLYINLSNLDDYLEINENDWIGLLTEEYSNEIVEELMKENYTWNYVEEMNKYDNI